MGDTNGAWQNPVGKPKLTDAADHCTPGLTEFIDSLSKSTGQQRPQYAPAPMPSPSAETVRQGILAMTPHIAEYQCPPKPVILDQQLLLPLQRGFIARPYLDGIDRQLELINQRTNAELDFRKKLTLIREARDYLWREHSFLHGLEDMIARRKPAFDVTLPEVKKVMHEVDTLAPLYATADRSYVAHIQAGKLK